jgi:hypothetical protein
MRADNRLMQRMVSLARIVVGYACVVTFATACEKSPPPSEPVQVTAAAAPPVVVAPTPAPATPPPSPVAAATEDVQEDETLDAETPEQDPGSPTVKLRLEAVPRSAHPVVFWGKTRLGEAPVTIERPRRSGPMDVLITAPGFLDYHTRLFTDRDDRLSIVMVRSSEAGNMLGYKRKADAGIDPGSADGGVAPASAGSSKPATNTPGFVMPAGVSF